MDAMTKAKFYTFACKYFTLIPPLLCPVLLFIDAPFGRFTPSSPSIFLVDGIYSWIFMETAALLAFIPSFLSNSSRELPLNHPANILAACFLAHYANRSIISPLRTPSRSQSHIIVPLCAVIFNLTNSFLLGTYLSSPSALDFLASSYSRPSFFVGLGIWSLGLAGNIWHDEMLFDIRRKANAKGKSKADGKRKEHYAIPRGWLYSYISYPNYLCEWIEWTGFAIAAAPLPSFVPFCFDLSSCLSLLNTVAKSASSISAPLPPPFDLSPPYIFLLAEVLLMLPRAYKGHKWYQEKFEEYPKERKAVVPFLL